MTKHREGWVHRINFSLFFYVLQKWRFGDIPLSVYLVPSGVDHGTAALYLCFVFRAQKETLEFYIKPPFQNTERLAELVAQRERASEAALSDVAHSQRHLQEIETEAAKGREACEQRHGVYTTLATDVKALEERLVHAQTSAAEVLREEDIAAAQNAETKHQADAFRNKTIEKAGIFRQAHEREREAKELITAAQDETSV